MATMPHSSSSFCRMRSEEHTSELQSRVELVCRLLLEKKKTHRSRQPAPVNLLRRFRILSPRAAASPGPPARARHRSLLFFFNAPATTEIYPLSLHDALPISAQRRMRRRTASLRRATKPAMTVASRPPRSEEHTSELQSRVGLVCRLLLE